MTVELNVHQQNIMKLAEKYNLGITLDGGTDCIILEVDNNADTIDKVITELMNVYGIQYMVDEFANHTELFLPELNYSKGMGRDRAKERVQLFGGSNEWVANIKFMDGKEADLAVNKKQLQEAGNIEDAVFATFPKETIQNITVNGEVVYKAYANLKAVIRNG